MHPSSSTLNQAPSVAPDALKYTRAVPSTRMEFVTRAAGLTGSLGDKEPKRSRFSVTSPSPPRGR